MNKKQINAIESYQCAGCVHGSDISCYDKNYYGGIGCGKHYSGTLISGIGSIFLGLPNGFNRIGAYKDLKPIIFETFEDSDWGELDMFNIPVWKFLTKDGHTLVRGIIPRRNEPFLLIYLEDCLDKINCLEITQEDVDGMD